MSETVLIAIIAGIPPTIAALAAVWQTRRLSRPIEDVNRAVNHRQPGQASLIETVDTIASEMGSLHRSVKELEGTVLRHLAHHQIIEEEQDL